MGIMKVFVSHNLMVDFLKLEGGTLKSVAMDNYGNIECIVEHPGLPEYQLDVDGLYESGVRKWPKK